MLSRPECGHHESPYFNYHNIINIKNRPNSQVAQWAKVLHRHQRLWVRAQPLSEPATTGRPMGRRTIGLASSGLGRVWPAGIVASRTSNSCGGPGAVYADQVAWCTVKTSDTLVRLASGLTGHCVKNQCGLVGLCFGGRSALDLCLSLDPLSYTHLTQPTNREV